MMWTDRRVAVVTGSGDEIDMRLCRALAESDHRVLLATADEARGATVIERLESSGLRIFYHQFDAGFEPSIDRLAGYVSEAFARADVLIVGAPDSDGDARDPSAVGANSLSPSMDALQIAIESRAAGAYLLGDRFIPMMRSGGYGRIVNISSGVPASSPDRAITDAALNAVTSTLAAGVGDVDIKVNQLSVYEEFDGDSDDSMDELVATAVWLASLPDEGPNGGVFVGPNQAFPDPAP